VRLQALDPVGRAARRRWPETAAESATLLSIYRARNLRVIEPLVSNARRLKMRVALWGLDGVVPELRGVTVGTGPGSRTALLDRLWDSVGGVARGPLVIADDDATFVRGDLGQLLQAAHECGFGIAQPAIAPGSHWSHRISVCRPLTFARATTFVEIGPVVVVSPEWQARVLPFPPDSGMGWGLDLAWHDLTTEGCRLGVIDAVTVRHVGPTGVSYDLVPEYARLGAYLNERGLNRIGQIQRCVGAWRVWQRQPPWIAGANGGDGR
jgi:hypothetical protein